MDQRHEWFLEGARAFRSVLQRNGRAHLLPADADVYPCPLCLDGFFTIKAIDTGELTREHVPPQSLGGRWLVLTCRTCNNDAGRFYDADAQKEERIRLFLAGQHQGMMRGSYTVNGVSHRGEMHLAPMLGGGPGSIMIVGADSEVGDPVFMAANDSGVGLYFQSVAKINSPAQAQHFDQVLDDAVGNQQLDLSFTPSFRFSPERARVSWIRSAYLVTFASLGWTYILEPALEQLREQFQARENATFPQIAIYDEGADPARREIAILTEPHDCESVMVTIGPHTIFLPIIGKPSSLTVLADNLQTRLHQAAASGTPVAFRGRPVAWPSKPEY